MDHSLINASNVAVVVACIAAATSLITLGFNLSAGFGKEVREENRKRIGPLVEDLGVHLYGIIGSLALFNKTDSLKDQRYFNNRILHAQKALRVLRGKLRYPLWGFDDAIKVLILLPGIAKNTQGEELRQLIKRATRLRASMDYVIRRCFKYGRPPLLYERWLVTYRVRRLTNGWEKTEPKPEGAAIAAFKQTSLYKGHNRLVAIVTKVEDDRFDAVDKNGNAYSIAKRSKVDTRSSSGLAIGSRVYLFKRSSDRDLHYSFVRTDQEQLEQRKKALSRIKKVRR